MFGIGEGELVLIALFAFMIFGPDKLPGAGKTIGRALRQFKDAQEGFTKVVQTEVIDPATKAMSLDSKADSKKEAARALDADRDVAGEKDAAAPKETFAERKARLARERAERLEAEAKAQAAQAEQDASQEKEAPSAEAAPQETYSAQDLYSMKRPQTSTQKEDESQA